MAGSRKLRMIWSVDAFEEANDSKQHIVETLKSFGQTGRVEIEPVYVLSPEELDISLELSLPWVKRYMPAAEKSLSHLVQQSGITAFKRPTVLIERKPSLNQAVKTLMKYAQKSKADVVVM